MKYVVIRKHNTDMVKSMKELEVGEIVGKAIKSGVKLTPEDFRTKGIPEDLIKMVGAHLEYLQNLQDNGILLEAGPFSELDESLLIYEVSSAEEVRKHEENDPYYIHGFFQDFSVHEWYRVF